MERKDFLKGAEQCVCSDRNQQYGEPEDNFTNIAKLWSAYLEEEIGAEDVAIMMVLFKVARLKGSGYQSVDSWVDLIGYAACGGEIAVKGVDAE